MPGETNIPPPGDRYISKVHIADTPITLRNWHKHVNWLNVTMIVLIPLYGCIQALWTPLRLKTAIWAVAYYFYTALGVTAGYHRLWAHRSYTATLPLRVILALAAGGSFQGSARWWARLHRSHHRYTDTERDPYSVHKGIFYAHFGWMILKQNPKRFGRTDISDLNADPVVVWQHRHFMEIVILMGLVVPMLVAGIWGDWWGGFVYAGILRIFFVQQATFCVNSLAHWLGEQPFDDRNSPRDHVITALATMGEGYHNFHHEFPSDYRNAIRWYQYDPTKWAIWCWGQVGLARDLKTFRENEIEKGRVQQLQKKVDRKRAELDWGTPLSELPVMEWEEFVERAKSRALVVVAGVVHDVEEFVREHPGGKAMIQAGVGKDATAMFNGGVYYHSNAAHNLLSMMRVAVIRGGCEVEAWKRLQKEM
ncbi:stearoyl-CoA desaturase [Aspergillus eucalypticola CBS 122712]|uniref:Acyl-CoA desaturase n=1 Tax=Aspergillus eucalypticola (strain CBS 122712 / IBT 29274) TaxID=1448314 RepID=A0A317UPP0_ASPEC|nr:stearoyl-CoA desaturase [Aspergillus eucalypticola CBS 122712]PWY63128.1 stearoyl-CoA desaturase [Aspergillus eucalypticola CBS 122712]